MSTTAPYGSWASPLGADDHREGLDVDLREQGPQQDGLVLAVAEAAAEDHWRAVGLIAVHAELPGVVADVGDHEVVDRAQLLARSGAAGDQRPFLSALVSLDPEAAEGMSNEEIQASVQSAVDEVNAASARVRQLKKYVILDEPLSIEHGELTPTLKVKRKVVREHFSDQIEAMYS